MGHAALRRSEGGDAKASSTSLRFRSDLNDLDPKAVRVELYADGINGGAPVRQEMKRVRQLAGRVGRLRLQRGGVCGPPTGGLHGASDTAPRRRCGSVGIRYESYGNDDENAPTRVARLYLGDLRAR